MFYIVASTDGAVEQAERKRQKARERYAIVPDEPKAEKNAKWREDYRRRREAKQTSNTTEQSGNY